MIAGYLDAHAQLRLFICLAEDSVLDRYRHSRREILVVKRSSYLL